MPNVDRREGEDEWFSTLAHEIVHLKAFLFGEQAKVTEQSKEAFVDTHMTEEIEAHATTYVTLLQSGILSNPAAGFDNFVSFLEKEHVDLVVSYVDAASEAEKWAEIKELAKPWLEKKYKEEWVGSSSGKNDYEKWGAYWDSKNPS